MYEVVPSKKAHHVRLRRQYHLRWDAVARLCFVRQMRGVLGRIRLVWRESEIRPMLQFLVQQTPVVLLLLRSLQVLAQL